MSAGPRWTDYDGDRDAYNADCAEWELSQEPDRDEDEREEEEDTDDED